MAINSLDISCDKTTSMSKGDGYKHRKSSGSCRVSKFDFSESSISSIISKQGKMKNSIDLASPYFHGDNSNVMSKMTEKRFMQKKGTIISSFPLAESLYKANSQEFKAAKNKKKVKKSVLTLPSTNNALLPKSCTVSDMNDAEYIARNDKIKKPKKRNPAGRKTIRRSNEFYDRDAKYCTHMNIDLDCSSTDMIKSYNGVAKRKSKPMDRLKREEGVNPHDVWTVLRNINTFQFTPSPPMSEESFITLKKKKKAPRRRNDKKDLRLVGTCRTEEIAYISSFELDSQSRPSLSQASSFDKVTVIDRIEDSSKICYYFGDKKVKKDLVKSSNIPKRKPLNNRRNEVNDRTNDWQCLPGEYNACVDKTHGYDNVCGDSTLVTYQNKVQLDNQRMNDKRRSENFDQYNRDMNNHSSTQTTLHDDIFYSPYSGSSKGMICQGTYVKCVKDEKKPVKGLLSGDSAEINGIKKVVTKKNLSLMHPNKPDLYKNNRESTFALNSPKIIPKLTQLNIMRQLKKLKYPIVILGKDQLTDKAFEVVYEMPQFHGLDEHIWTFMLEWNKPGNTTGNNLKNDKRYNRPIASQNKDKLDNLLNRALKTASGKQFTTKGKQIECKNKQNKIEHKQTSYDLTVHVEEPAKLKPMQQLWSRHHQDIPVLKITPQDIEHTITRQSANPIKVEMNDKSGNDSRIPISISKQSKPTNILSEKSPWSKTKRVSLFIDNVIRKIKNGVYFTTDRIKEVTRKSSNLDNKDSNADVKVISDPCTTIDKTMQSISKVTIKKKLEPLTPIPGFDNSIPKLEIETMTSNEIAVKHCVTNIIVRFDVMIPANPELNLKQSFTVIPLEDNENKTRMFKCKASILNAILPAEICSLLPKMMKNLIDYPDLYCKPLSIKEKTDNKLSPILETTRCESPRSHTFSTTNTEIRRLLDGKYSNTDKLRPKQEIVRKRPMKYDRLLVEELTPCLLRGYLEFYKCKLEPALPNKVNKTTEPKIINTCTALVPYKAHDTRFLNLTNVLPQVDNINCINAVKNVYLVKANYFLFDTPIYNTGIKDSILRVYFENFKIVNSKIACNINITNGINFYSKESKEIPAIEYKIEKKIDNPKYLVLKNKRVKTKALRIKSAPNIPEEKATSLNKIRDLDDFFKALGAGSVLSNVFDNKSGGKIMACIMQMKSWTKEINCKQALLVLLLTNKKETPNLIQYRPVILQGISVNRITRAHELDMEIEVIEREQLKRIPHCDGISYLPASIENQDSLYEELYWIAKTTASDYQRPFDESSEKLLRSLLEKRKKLNPSYLRVMARYVGLGLLKKPGK